MLACKGSLDERASLLWYVQDSKWRVPYQLVTILMNKTRCVLCLSMALFLCQTSLAQTAAKLLWATVKVVTGAAAITALSNAAEAKDIHEEKIDIIQRLRASGIDPTNGAIYSVYLSLNGNAEAIYWADLIGRPDVFIVISVEGRGSVLIPRVHHEYSGQPILENLIDRDYAPGTKVVISIFDDDSFSDSVWNGMVQTRVSLNLGASFQCGSGFEVKAGAAGTIQLMNHMAIIDPPDYLGGMEFVLPTDTSGGWFAEGKLHDGLNREVGVLGMKRVWKADVVAYEQQLEEARATKKRFILWGGFGIVLALVFGKMLISKN